MTDLQRQILRLRQEGMSFRAIAKTIPCSSATVHYSLGNRGKEKCAARNRRRRLANTARLKAEYGGQCAACGYDKCSEALEFDHLVPETKTEAVSTLRHRPQEARDEASKCILLCCRCHRERHVGLLDIGAHLEPTI